MFGGPEQGWLEVAAVSVVRGCCILRSSMSRGFAVGSQCSIVRDLISENCDVHWGLFDWMCRFVGCCV